MPTVAGRGHDSPSGAARLDRTLDSSIFHPLDHRGDRYEPCMAASCSLRNRRSAAGKGPEILVGTGGVAVKAGLNASDVIVRIAGSRLCNDPNTIPGTLLETGGTVEREIDRAGRRRSEIANPLVR